MNRRHSLVIFLLVALIAIPAAANHSWGSYHWARTSNPFTLKVYDNLSSNWDPYLSVAASDWSQSQVLNLNVLWNTPLSKQRRCSSATGVIEICNTTYGNNGWLGIAGISVSGSHITKGYTKLNDTYFNTSTYNTPAWRQMVTCQEIGHDFGLDHQDENFNNANLGTCMDYTNNPGTNQHPNAHDYAQLESIYAHLDSTTTIAGVINSMSASATRVPTVGELMADAAQWGTPVRYDAQGRPNLFVQPVGVGSDGALEMNITFVTWADRSDTPGDDNGKEIK